MERSRRSHRSNRFIGGLIDLARIGSGEIATAAALGNSGSTIFIYIDLVLSLRRRTEELRSRLKRFFVVRVDERAVSEVVYTSIDNAAKYSPDVSTITITARRLGEGTIMMAVEDQGAGIALNLR